MKNTINYLEKAAKELQALIDNLPTVEENIRQIADLTI